MIARFAQRLAYGKRNPRHKQANRRVNASVLPPERTPRGGEPIYGPPALPRMWGDFPASRHPYVSAIHIVVIAADPNIVRAGSGYPRFDNRRGRSNLDDHLGAHGADAQEQPKGRTDQ